MKLTNDKINQRYRIMKESKFEKKPSDLASYPGVLKMVKVKKGKRGHGKSRSLVFRISRNISKSTFDDSGIQCPSPEHETSENEHTKAPPTSSKAISPDDECVENPFGFLNVKSPSDSGEHRKNSIGSLRTKSLNDDENTFGSFKMKLTDEGYAGSPQETLLDDEHSESPLGSLEEKIACPHPGSLKIKIPKSVLNRNQENVTTLVKDLKSPEHLALESENDRQSASSNTNLDLLNYMDVGNAPQMEDVQSYQLRRCSRRILLRLQKNDQSDSTNNQISNSDKSPSPPCSSKQSTITGEKRKRGRKPGPGAEGKKRKYAKRGRPPKNPASRNLNIIPVIAGSVPDESENLLFKPPKNSVWTLIPKKFLDSDFFKSQVLKVRFLNSRKKANCSLPPSFSSCAVPSKVPLNNNKYLTEVVKTEPEVRQKAPDASKNYKRPTVIYFKKNFQYTSDQCGEFTNTVPVSNGSEFCKSQNDLMYLFNKYRTLEYADLKKYYESANGDLNETENMVLGLMSRNPEEDNSCLLQNNLTDKTVFGTGSSDTRSHGKNQREDFPGPYGDVSNVDTLLRSVIVESLQILFSEEAVLP